MPAEEGAEIVKMYDDLTEHVTCSDPVDKIRAIYPMVRTIYPRPPPPSSPLPFPSPPQSLLRPQQEMHTQLRGANVFVGVFAALERPC